jgi:formylglycine-generating enzyme
LRPLRHLIAAIACSAMFGTASCESEPTKVRQGQILLYVDTDAPIPAGPDRPPNLATPLFDRLRIDVYAPGAPAPCADCTNEFELNSSVLSRRAASVGIAPPSKTTGYRARVRLFKAAFASKSGEPNADSTLETTIALPIVENDAILERTVVLETASVGHPVGSLTAPGEPRLGPPTTSIVGTWAGAQRTNCSGAAPEGAVCVPGGAYWMGNPNALGFAPASYVPSPRLVVLSPFFMSATEVTTRQYRARGVTPTRSWSGYRTGSTATDWCTFTKDPGPFDAIPINCVTWEEVRAYCTAAGGDLPTEAQFEYVAGGLVGNVFPWGRDEPMCTEAIFGRGAYGILANIVGECKQPEPPGSPAVPGEGTRDRVDLPTGTILDLGGNMAEWTRDLWNRIDEPCWERREVYRDPLCTTASPNDGLRGVRRGGNWAEQANFMIASNRFAQDRDFFNVQTGFRCVWPSP